MRTRSERLSRRGEAGCDLAVELEIGLPPGAAGFFAREGELVSRSFAKIFFNMTIERESVCESRAFATLICPEASWARTSFVFRQRKCLSGRESAPRAKPREQGAFLSLHRHDKGLCLVRGVRRAPVIWS